MIGWSRWSQYNELRGLEEEEKDGTVQQRFSKLAKFHQPQKAPCGLSYSRWEALSSVNRGIAGTAGGESQLLHHPS